MARDLANIWFVNYTVSSVADPCHFGVDPNPDPPIHASD